VVLEEAHSYLGRGESSPAAIAVRRIVKEGRKYGMGAMIVSQRPAEIDATILSQCGTLFAMRLSNSSDRAHVTSAVTDNLEGLLSMLPVLRTGEAIILGEAVQLPVRTQLEAPPAKRRPIALTLCFTTRMDQEDGIGVGSPPTMRRSWPCGESRTLNRQVLSRLSTRRWLLNRVPAQSSNVKEVGYDGKTMTLEIEFNDGGVYQYFDVPETVHAQLMSAASQGKFFSSQIKGVYRYAKV
jgi:hypothetical protein